LDGTNRSNIHPGLGVYINLFFLSCVSPLGSIISAHQMGTNKMNFPHKDRKGSI
jgi:hypothetical protein